MKKKSFIRGTCGRNGGNYDSGCCRNGRRRKTV